MENFTFCAVSTFSQAFLKEKNQANRDNYKVHHNFRKKLLRKTKNSHFNDIDTKIRDNGTFWKTVVPLCL